MKMKKSAAFTVAAAIAASATAQDEAYGITTSDTRASHRKTSSISDSIGQSVQPGRVLSKQERELRRAERADSAIATLDGQLDAKLDYDLYHTFAHFKAKLLANAESSPLLQQLDQGIEHWLSPGAGRISVEELRTGSRHYNLRSLITLLIAFLLVFGALYTLGGYLLFVTRASACSVSTVYFPVTYTVTPGVAPVSALPESNDTQPTTTYTSTTTHVSTLTETEIVTTYRSAQPEATSVEADPADGTTYVYTVNSAGVTEWINGVSPSSGASLVTMTTTVVIQPVPLTNSATASRSTTTILETVTPPAYTSTLYSYAGPDLTSTSTSTHYVTLTVSEVSPPASITTTRTSFPGVSSDGWNATSPADPETSVDAALTHDPISTTITAISYFGTGDRTTSTHTMFITTTLAEAYTTTISQVVESPVGSGYVITITAVPVTITPVASGPLFSTSVTLPPPGSVSTATSSSIIESSSTIQNSTSPSHSRLSSSSMVSGRPQLTPGTSLAHANSSYSVTSTTRSRPVGNSTTSIASQSSRGPESGASVAEATIGSITSTISATGVNHTQSSGQSQASISSPSSHSSIAQITSTVSHVRSSVSPRFSIDNTISEISTTISGVSGSSGPSLSLASQPPMNSTKSSAGYGSPNASSTYSQQDSTSLSLANSFTSLSTTSAASRPSSTLTSSSPSTLATSIRSLMSQSMTNTSVESSTSLTPTTASVSALSSSVTSQTGDTSNSETPSRTSASLPSGESISLTPSTANPFPASSATATPTAGCGEHGDFMVDFDDLPRFLPTNSKNTTITEAPPVLNPYHHLTLSDGYVYAPEPGEPYQPASQPHLAVFLANATGRTASPFGSLVRPGEIGDGPRDPISAFWFDAKSAFFGCDNPGPADCTLVLSAFTWNATANTEMLTHTQNVAIPPCASMTKLNCQLHPVEFPDSFRSLTGLQVQAYTGSDSRMFFMDDLALRWSNNSCAAGLLRQSSR